MMLSTHTTGIAALLATVFALSPAVADEQEAIDGCIDQLRVVGGPDGQGGTVISSEFSQAATLVMLRDAGGTEWRCLAYSDGTVAELSMQQPADDGGGAMAGSGATTDSGKGQAVEPGTSRVVVKFQRGTSGAEYSDTLAPGESRQYVLGAKNGQFLYFRLAANGPNMSYQIFNPDQSFLLDQMSADKEYRGQLWQNGNHVIEVINRSNGEQSYNVIFGVE
jgi:hypothetical protein